MVTGGGVHVSKNIATDRGVGYLGRKATLKGPIVDNSMEDKEERQVEVQLVDEGGEGEGTEKATDSSKKGAADPEVVEEVKSLDGPRRMDVEEVAEDGEGTAGAGAGAGLG